MNAPQKRTAAETWAAIQAMEEDDAADLEADEAAAREADRIMALSPEDLRRELVEAGFDPNEVRARAEQLTAEVLRTFEQPTGADPTAAAPATPAPADAGPQLASSTPKAQTTATAPIPLHPAAKPAVTRGPSRVRTALMLLAAAFVILLALSWRTAGEAIARWIHPPDPTILPDKPSPSMLAEAYAKKRAKDLRDAAHSECANAQWETCVQALDEAAKLDPAGDTADPVQHDRAAARDARSPRQPPPTGPKPH